MLTMALKTFYRSGVQETTTHQQLLKVTEKIVFSTTFRSCRFFVVYMTKWYKMFLRSCFFLKHWPAGEKRLAICKYSK